MNENPNRRKDDARPSVALQWGDRPDHWTLLLTGATSGMIGPLGSTWPNQPAELERVDVCVRRKDGPVAVYRTGGEGANKWEQFYHYDSIAQPLRDGEYLFREGAALKPEFTHPMMLAAERAGVSFATQQKCWAAWFDARPPKEPAAPKAWTKESVKELATSIAEAVAKNASTVPQLTFPHIYLGLLEALVPMPPRRPIIGQGGPAELGKALAEWVTPDLEAAERARLREELPVPDAVAAALTDAVVHGTGAFRVNGDGSTEHVDLQRDALYTDYSVPKPEGGAS